jgi:hypothetical protein
MSNWFVVGYVLVSVFRSVRTSLFLITPGFVELVKFNNEGYLR